ncbi:D-isomer specific 2-hydroxyacid dehydrogenase [Xylogone sp. PMI_703]|nr:D-isomer specific 2-hydroxyacid dehydrogenase [Xylogone sp. PMI_703]
MGSTPPISHKVVALEARFCDIPTLELPEPHRYEIDIYHNTLASEVPCRIKDAEILVITTVKLNAEVLSEACCPHLRLIVAMASGTDCIDLEACKARGITVCNSPNVNTAAVSEHAIALYFAARKRMVAVHQATRRNEWIERGTLMGLLRNAEGKAPLTCEEEVMGIIGYGAIGKRIVGIAKMLGMQVLISGRKGATTCPSDRTPFEDVLRKSTVVLLALPRTKETTDLISTAELRTMRHDAVIVNISRGGIVNEAALVTALRENVIAGAGTDVFEKEPAGIDNSPLLAEDVGALNLTVTPHLAWFADSTHKNLQRVLNENIVAWCLGKPQNIVV